jgi:predicted phosphate transport protein (TIGR00153 family)
MRRLLSLLVLLAPVTTAQAAVVHTVAPGETLWQLAAMNNMTTRSFAAANGLSPDAHIVAGTTIQIPTIAEAAGALASAPAAGDGDNDADDGAAGAAPPPMGAYTVRPGDSLSAIAVTARVPMSAIAAMNGLDPNGVLISGTVIKLPTGSPAPAGASLPAPATTRVPQAAPYASSGRVSSADIAAVASRNGVPASLASAIAWQESGFNNAMVSGANARGVMQVMPGTWNWVQANLARRHLDPNSAIDNVGAGVLYLGHLLQQTGGDPALAAAGYYQGIGSVRAIGMLPETKRYVANVMALRARFGGSGACRPFPLRSAAMARLTQMFAPADREFFELFEEAGSNTVRAADLLDQLLRNWPDNKELGRDILICEQEGDRITHDLIRKLNNTFVTPIDREDILVLASGIDDIVDFTEEVADYLALYKIEAPMEQAQRLSHVLLQCTRQIAEAIPRLRGFRDINQYVVEINRLENDGDRITREAIASLFDGGIDPMVVIRWKDIFERLEAAIDACERIAHILESVVIKNA